MFCYYIRKAFYLAKTHPSVIKGFLFFSHKVTDGLSKHAGKNESSLYCIEFHKFQFYSLNKNFTKISHRHRNTNPINFQLSDYEISTKHKDK